MKKLTSLTTFCTALLGVLLLLALSSRTSMAGTLSPHEVGLPPRSVCATYGPSGTPYDHGINCRHIHIDGFPRTYVVFHPPAANPGPAPVVFLFHGTNGDGIGYLHNSGWLPKAQAEGIILVSASGLRYCPEVEPGIACSLHDLNEWESKWHTYQLAADYDLSEPMPGYPAGAPWPPRDVDFVRRIMVDIRMPGNGLSVDSHRIFASGFSAGGGFTARVARELPNRFAAVAYSSGGFLHTSVITQASSVSIPVFVLIGTHEPGFREIAYGSSTSNPPLPLDPVSFLALGDLMASLVIPHLKGFNYHDVLTSQTPPAVLEGGNHTLYRWTTGQDNHILQLGVLEGLMHTPPNGCDAHKNPLGWYGPDIYWDFFTSAANPAFSPIPTHVCQPAP